MEYDSSESWRVYDLERKCFDVSHDVTFVETEFPVAGDFPGFDPTLLQQDMENPDPTRFLQNLQEPAAGTSRFAPSSVATDVPPVVHDMVVVEPPPAVQVMAVQSRVRLVRNTEPANYHDAMMRMDADKWLNAMHTELQSLEDNNTWVLCELPRGRRVIGTKWVCKIKVDAMNVLERYKARIVAQGFSQIAGLDFDETWAPFVRIESVRVLFALAALFDLWIIHIDAKTAFLNGDSDAELYVRQPEGFVDMRYPNHVLRLCKSLYGLKQAPRIWYLLLCETIISLGFDQCTADPSIYFHPEYKIILAVYVDDILIMGKTQEICDQFYGEISQHFCMEYKGPVTSFLSLNVIQDGLSIAINQIGYIEHMIQRFQMDKAKPADSPLNASLPL